MSKESNFKKMKKKYIKPTKKFSILDMWLTLTMNIKEPHILGHTYLTLKVKNACAYPTILK